MRTKTDGKWGLTWVGGVLLYDAQEEAERAHRLYGSGVVIPPGEPTSPTDDEGASA